MLEDVSFLDSNVFCSPIALTPEWLGVGIVQLKLDSFKPVRYILIINSLDPYSPLMSMLCRNVGWTSVGINLSGHAPEDERAHYLHTL